MADEKEPEPNIDERLKRLKERLERLAHDLEGHLEAQKQMEAIQQATSKNLDRLAREVRQFGHFVLAMGANIEPRLLLLEDPFDEDGNDSKPNQS